MVKTPSVVHHMAANDGQTVPQNSLEGVRASLQAGAAVIEVDINALADDDYLLVHEPDLSAETNGAGKVGETSTTQARSLFIKTPGAVTAYRVPLLSDVVSAFKASPAHSYLQLDFKNAVPFTSNEPLLRLLKLIEPIGDRVIVSSCADWQMRKLRKLAPWLAIGFDIMWYIDWAPPGEKRDPRSFPRRLGEFGYLDDHLLASEKYTSTEKYLRDRCEYFIDLVPDVNVFYLEHPFIVQSLRDGFNWAEALHERGIKLDAWTMDITNPAAVENVKLMLTAGVDLFTSNTPRAISALLKI